jgi:hypothetical protein
MSLNTGGDVTVCNFRHLKAIAMPPQCGEMAQDSGSGPGSPVNSTLQLRKNPHFMYRRPRRDGDGTLVCGVQEGHFGYMTGPKPDLGTKGKFEVPVSKVRFKTAVAKDEIDLEFGFLIMPQVIAQAAPTGPKPAHGAVATGPLVEHAVLRQ